MVFGKKNERENKRKVEEQLNEAIDMNNVDLVR
jgi:hypothetical protein